MATGHKNFYNMQTIEFKGEKYPAFQAEGFAAEFAFPFAKKVCKGTGYDIGCGKLEWALPNACPIDRSFNNGYDAMNLPLPNVDYIFSSHCLEHLDNWVDALDYWTSCLNDNGILFLYLPDYSQKYWRPWSNRKHKNIFKPQILRDYMEDKGFTDIFHSEKDLNNSFMIYGTWHKKK